MRTNYFFDKSIKNVIFLTLIIPAVLQLTIINFVEKANNEIIYYLLFVVFGLLYLPYFSWLYNSINFLYKVKSKFFKLKIRNFNICLIINFLVVLNFVFYISYLMGFVINGGKPNIKIFLIIGIIQMVGIIAFNYSVYFVCKLILTYELKKEVNFIDIVGNIITMAFPPITIWKIQNKIQDIQNLKKKL